MAITIKDIHEKEFTKQVRGYSIDEVDDFLDDLADQMEVMIKENRDLMAQLEAAKSAPQPAAPVVVETVQPEPVRSEPIQSEPVQPEQPAAPAAAPLIDEPQYFKNLETTLRETLINAQRLADETIADAQKKANDILASAEEEAAGITASAKAEVETLRVETESLKTSAADYRARFLNLLKAQEDLFKADDSPFAE